MRYRIPVKPVSTNTMYQSSGRKWKSAKYLKFERLCELHLSKYDLPDIPNHGDLEIHVLYGVSARFDIDNCLKAFIDILQKELGFNDARIMRIVAEKTPVRRGQEFIEFELFLRG